MLKEGISIYVLSRIQKSSSEIVLKAVLKLSWFFVFLFLSSVLFVCGIKEENVVTIVYPQEDCNLLSRYTLLPDEVKDECFFPFPFTQFYSDGKVRISKNLFKRPEGYPEIVVDRLNNFDGFSPASQIMFWHPKGFSRDNLPSPEATVRSDSPVQVIHHPTGERIPVFVEPDARANPPFQVLYIRPLRRMKHNSRYVVVIKKEIRGFNGEKLDSPLFFGAIVDGKDVKISDLKQDVKRWKEHFKNILSFIELHGINKNDVLVAWDFKTASDDMILSEMLRVRDKVYGSNITFTIDSVENFPHAASRELLKPYRNLIARSVSGRFYPPKVDGEGVFEASFLLHIPICVFQYPVSAFKPMLFGHGLFGSTLELNSHYVIFAAEYFCTPVIATNWKGIDIEAFGHVFEFISSRALHAIQVVEYIVDNLRQGHANFLALAILVRRREFWNKITSRAGTFQVDIENPVYYGISNGGVQGGTFMALTKEIKLGVLDVGGGIWTSLLERNRTWDALRVFLYPEGDRWEIELKKVIAVAQMIFDIVDPITFSPHIVSGNENLGIIPKKIIYREALYDEQVANFATRAFAITAGIPAIRELPEDFFGIQKVEAKDGYAGSGYIQVDPKIDGVPEYQYKNVSLSLLKKQEPKSKVVRSGWPLEPNEGDFVAPHYVPRLVPVILEMQRRFYEEGKIYQLCSDNICDPD